MGAIAPTKGGGNTSRLYVAPCASGAVNYANDVQTGGVLMPFAAVANPMGIATHPTGQY